MMQYTPLIRQDEDWWIGQIKEVSGAIAQERTKDELLISLHEALVDILKSGLFLLLEDGVVRRNVHLRAAKPWVI